MNHHRPLRVLGITLLVVALLAVLAGVFLTGSSPQQAPQRTVGPDTTKAF